MIEPDTRAPRTYYGRLTVGTYLKISLFMGVTSGIVFSLLYGVIATYRILTAQTPPVDDYTTASLRMIAILPFSSAIGSAISALAGFPLYVWICNRRGGHVITGFMRELGGEPARSSNGAPEAHSAHPRANK